MWNRCLDRMLAAGMIAAALSSCHEEDLLAANPTFSIGGTVAGSTGLLTLQNSNGTTLTIAANGSFVFATPMVNGAMYNVTVVVPPAEQNCYVANGAGTVGISDITQVEISCAENPIKLAALTRD